MLMICVDFEEDIESLMVHFLAGLNPETREVMELQYYLEIVDLVEKTIKVERQLKPRRNWASTRSSNHNSGRDPHGFERRDEQVVE